MKASRRRSCWRGVSRSREARKRLRTWVEGITLAPAVTGRVLLDAATHLTWSVASELDNMEGIETLVASWSWSSTAFLLSLEGIQCRDLHPCTEVFSALF